MTIYIPSLQIELEKLNSSTDVINKLELDLEVSKLHLKNIVQDMIYKEVYTLSLNDKHSGLLFRKLDLLFDTYWESLDVN